MGKTAMLSQKIIAKTYILPKLALRLLLISKLSHKNLPKFLPKTYRMYAIKTPLARAFGREAYYLVAGLMNYPFHFKSYVCGALFESVIGVTPYLPRFEVEGKLKVLLCHHLVAFLTVPLIAVSPLMLGLSIAVGKADGNDIVAWPQ